ncbi:hypothetical protein B0H34DRAFT_727620 [Crassisporium funariophilum]|nr:hypothetical protein B0H34DRAFT_727620 [Crassisporium funariophilum]
MYDADDNDDDNDGISIKLNLMNGCPTRTKKMTDYVGMPIPPCGDLAKSDTGLDNRAPWLSSVEINAECLSLDEEIKLFIGYMEPTRPEISMRKNLVERFTDLIESFAMGVTVVPFGSYITGLYLPISDIDMVISFDTTHEFKLDFEYVHALVQLEPLILSAGFASKVESRFKASVPIMRITDKITGIDIDLIAAKHHSIKSTEAALEWISGKDQDIMKALILVTKTFLSIRRCGTTYTGGINSYLLVWMVVAWTHLEMPKMKQNVLLADRTTPTPALQKSSLVAGTASHTSGWADGHPSIPDTGQQQIGEALISFMRFYADEFNYRTQAIKIEPVPTYQPKRYDYTGYFITQRYLLSIFDPADIRLDMGSKAYAIKHIQETFKVAYQCLLDLHSRGSSGQPVKDGGLLGMILEGDFTKFISKREASVEGWRTQVS